MGKESIVEIPEGSGNFYRYDYDPDTQRTRYQGPVGDAPEIGESEFLVLIKQEPSGACPECGSGDVRDVAEGIIWCDRCRKHVINEPFIVDTEKKARINIGSKKRMNTPLWEMSRQYHRSIPLDNIFMVLKKEGVVPVQEDWTPWAGLLLGREGRASIDLVKRAPDGTYHPVVNAMLVLSWYKMEETDNYEVNVYVS